MRTLSTLKRQARILLLLAAGIVAPVGCGGGADSPSESLACGPDFRVPNYVRQVPKRYHWSGFPLRLYFEPASEFATPENRARFLASWQSWSDAVGGRITYTVVTEQEAADVEIHLVSRAEVVRFAGNDAILGTTKTDLVGDRLTHCRLYIAMTDNRDTTLTMAHEIGHALGIAGHSPNTADLMYALQQVPGPTSPTERDANTLLTAYCGEFPQKEGQPGVRHRVGTTSETIICPEAER